MQRSRRPPGRPPVAPTPLKLQLLLLGGAVLFSAALATVWLYQATPRFSVQQLVERQSRLRSSRGLAPPPPPPSPTRRGDRRAVWWFAPFFSGSGMGTEALQLVLGLQRFTEYRDGRLWASSHGDEDKLEVFSGLPTAAQQALAGMVQAGLQASRDDARAAIVVCHSEPGAWALPQPLYQTSLCPPVPLGEAAYVVARAMFESDRLSKLHVDRCNQMYEVWVPTEFHRGTFAASGVNPAKLQVVPEPVDVEAFDPSKCAPLPLPLGTRVFGPAWPHAGSGGSAERRNNERFVFLSVFKWEARKGWDVLLRAFLSAFTAADPVVLLLHTQPFHSSGNFAQQMQAWAQRELDHTAQDAGRLPSVYVLGEHIPAKHFARLYKSADAFVLPTRGEGWGLPIVESMAMGLPVIATNWSGPTAYLDESVGYPLPIDGLVEAPPDGGAFAGHRWAQPSVPQLQRLMRHVVEHRQEAAARGRAARRRMAERYAPDVVAQQVAAQLRRIENKLAQEQ